MKKTTIMENVKIKLKKYENTNKLDKAVYINFEEYPGSSIAFIDEINQGLYGSNLKASLYGEQIRVILKKNS